MQGPARRKIALALSAAILIASFPIAIAEAGRARQGDLRSLAPAVAVPAPAGMTTVIVTLRDQLDPASVAAPPDASRASRREGLIRALQVHAANAQRSLLQDLQDDRARGLVANVVPFWVFDGLSLTATPQVIAAVAARPEVASIAIDSLDIVALARPAPKPTPTPAPTPTPTPTPTPSPTPTPLPDPTGAPEPNIAAVNAPALWALGDTGHGVVVANLDSGVDATHPDLGPRWRGGSNSWYDPYGQHPATPIDLTGHGTGTMGVIVGGDAGGTTIGMAPGATWIAARIFNDSGSATATAIHAAFQWVLDPDGDPATDDAADVVDNSWSYGSIGCNLEFQPDLQALRAAGILPVFAGGNFGPASSTSVSPANNPEALAVGAVDGTGVIDPSSSRGPSSCGEPATTYPELVAPGVGIRTADRDGFYQVATGTSEAAPHVAGALALLLSAHPGLTATQQAAALAAGAVDLGTPGPDDTYGAGLLDVLAAHEWLVANPPPPSTVTQAVAVPGLQKGYGFWVTVTAGGSGQVAADWQLPSRIQATLAIYAGNPFSGGPDPVKLSPPAGALATASGRGTALTTTTAAMPPGSYTVYFYASGSLAASSGTVTYSP